jgi:hypothetical protein
VAQQEQHLGGRAPQIFSGGPLPLQACSRMTKGRRGAVADRPGTLFFFFLFYTKPIGLGAVLSIVWLRGRLRTDGGPFLSPSVPVCSHEQDSSQVMRGRAGKAVVGRVGGALGKGLKRF